MSMKNSNDTIGNRTRDLPNCRAVPLIFKYSGPFKVHIPLYKVKIKQSHYRPGQALRGSGG
jgi:hypothetical protein